jgi:hypothetical protein
MSDRMTGLSQPAGDQALLDRLNEAVGPRRARCSPRQRACQRRPVERPAKGGVERKERDRLPFDDRSGHAMDHAPPGAFVRPPISPLWRGKRPAR